ncbi:hypothetical protein TH53_19170 [Pedobacter lusitanus]|uniref:Viral A-type inclusion protein n=1 Tax=Pedobacter lusitanus TaxID=1503925 RepID=A0A0D0F292_9SPHI|nr:hypothetical protein [Pedobacter lusitanus]KIO75698.1 hypothetical protein TH53_19170 [Pedobacter lusitanus]
MKLFLAAIVLVTGAVACTQTPNYKTERDEVMKFHDTVMEDHGILVNNQMKLDSMLKDLPALKAKFPATDTVKEKVAMKATLERLNGAEELMNDWMHKFEPDVTGKSNEDAISYFKAERIKIGKIDSLYKAEIQSSDAYLKQFKK